MISQTTQYAIRAIIELGQHPLGTQILTKTLSDDLGIPQHYLGKILQQLARARILTSTRGRHGGFALAKPAGEIRLFDVIEPLDDVDKKRECILGQDMCSDKVACPMHDFWKKVRDLYILELEDKTVADLAEFGQRQRAAKISEKPKKRKSKA